MVSLRDDVIIGGSNGPLDSDLAAIAALNTTAFGRSLLTTVNESSMEPFNIENFGAISGADSTAAVNAAMFACPAGGSVYIPVGTFLLSSTINWDPTKNLKGLDRDQSRLQVNHNGDGIIVAGTPSSLCKFQNFQLITAGLPSPSSTGIGLTISCFVETENVTVQGFGSDGVKIIGNVSTSTNANLGKHKSLWVQYNVGNGVNVVGDNANVIVFDQCNATANVFYGFKDTSALGNYYNNCHTAGNGSGSFYASGASNSTIWNGCYAEVDQLAAQMLANKGKRIGGSFIKVGLLGGVVTHNGAMSLSENSAVGAAVIATDYLELSAEGTPSTIIDFQLSSSFAPVAYQRFRGTSISGSGGVQFLVDGIESARMSSRYDKLFQFNAFNNPAEISAQSIAFNLTTKSNVTGSKASGAALTSLLGALVALGLITDSTTP
jgi:hypothetical protein